MGPTGSVTAHPFTSVYSLQAVIDRAQSPQRISFSMEGLLDAYRMQFINIGEFAVKKLSDLKNSYVSILNFKFALKAFLLGEYLDGLNIPASVKSQLRKVFDSFESVRKHVTNYDGCEFPDLSWQVGWASSCLLTSSFIEDMVYTTTFDGRIKDGIKTHAELRDLMEYASIQERLTEIKDAIKAENPETAGGTIVPPVVSVNGDTQEAGSAAGNTGGTGTGVAATAKPTTGFDSLSDEDQSYWLGVMKKVIARHVKLIPDTGSTNELAAKITNCPMAMMRGDPSGLILYLFDLKKYGESLQRPEIRLPAFREAQYSRLVQTVLQSRNKTSADAAGESTEVWEASLGPGEMAMIFDGGKRGLVSKLISPWKPKKDKSHNNDADAEDGNGDDDDEEPATKNVTTIVPSLLNIGYDGDSVAARRKVVRGTLSLKQMEGANILSHNKISLPEKGWGHYPGTNQGDTLLGVVLPPYDSTEVWKLTWKQKKALYGKKHLIAVGGKTLGSIQD